MTEQARRPSVVVIGGGYGGVNVAKALDEVADVTLVEPKDAFFGTAMTASSVSLAAVTPIRSKHSATMLLGEVSRLISRSMGVMRSRR